MPACCRRSILDKAEIRLQRGGSLPVSLLDLILGSIWLDAKLIVELAFFHHLVDLLGVLRLWFQKTKRLGYQAFEGFVDDIATLSEVKSEGKSEVVENG